MQNLGVFRFPEDAEAKEKGVPQNVEIGTAIGNGFSFNCWKEDGSVDQEKLDACYVLATQYFNDDTYNERSDDSRLRRFRPSRAMKTRLMIRIMKYCCRRILQRFQRTAVV